MACSGIVVKTRALIKTDSIYIIERFDTVSTSSILIIRKTVISNTDGVIIENIVSKIVEAIGRTIVELIGLAVDRIAKIPLD